MNELTSRSSRRYDARSLAVALIAIAMAGAIAFLSFGMATPAMAATGDSSGSLSAGSIATQATATKASAFEYKYGRYVENGKVQKTKCWYGTKKVDGDKVTRTKSKYGPEFTISSIGGSGSIGYARGGYGYDCGAGVYITGFKGSADADVVVPNKIGGKPVVCVSLAGAHMKSLDVSQCKSLKALNVGFSAAGGTECTIGEIKFGKNSKLEHFNLDRSTVSETLKITPANIKVLRIMFSNPMNGFSYKAPKVRSLSFFAITGLRVGSSKYLKELNVPDCRGCDLELSGMPQLVSLNVENCALGKLSVSKNKKLKTIRASGNNFNKKTISALKKWKKAKKGRTLSL